MLLLKFQCSSKVDTPQDPPENADHPCQRKKQESKQPGARVGGDTPDEGPPLPIQLLRNI